MGLGMDLQRIALHNRPECLGSEPVLEIRSGRAGQPERVVNELMIRAFDMVVGIVLLLLLAPLFILVAVAVRLGSPGPVLFIQNRVGRGGGIFPCLKFRTMRMNAELVRPLLESRNEQSGPIFKMRNDPRITRVGKFLRRSSLDELPQLINIVKGDMSLVGPRPAIPSEVDRYTAYHRERLTVYPGLTGLWQVSGRSDLSFDQMIELDNEYVRNRCLLLNIVILIKTIPAVLTARGAY